MNNTADIVKTLMVVCNPKHPHYGCTGKLTGEVISLLGTPMAKVTADNCQHKCDGFFVSSGDLQPIVMATVAQPKEKM